MNDKAGTKSIFAANLKHVLRLKSISQRQLATISNISYSTINDYTSKKMTVNVDTLDRISSVLSLNTCTLIAIDLTELNLESIHRIDELLANFRFEDVRHQLIAKHEEIKIVFSEHLKKLRNKALPESNGQQYEKAAS